MNVQPSVENDFSVSDPVPSIDRAGIELKLLAPQEAFELVGALPIIVQHARNRGVFRRLETVYYDTPEQLLRQHGMSLCVRHSGKYFIQMLEVPAADGGPLERRRWEVPVDGIAPDLVRLPAEEIGVSPTELTEGALVPIFTAKVRRRTQRLDLPDASVELVFDEGAIEADTRHEALSEIALRLKGGNAGALFDLGVQLVEAAPLQFVARSTMERGYALAFDGAPPTAKAALPEITTGQVIDDVIALLMESCWQQILQNHASADQGSDPEGVHQMRLALRRLRTICTMFRHDIPSPAFQAINCDAKWLMKKLGRAREWDVFAETITRLVAAVPDADLGGLRDETDRRRKSSYGGVRAVLADPRCNRFLLSLGGMMERRGWRNDIGSDALITLSQPVAKLSDEILARLHRKVLKRGAHFRHLDYAAQHRLRVDVKKLRYAVEFLLPLYADHAPAKRYAKRLAKLQSGLGRVCDIANSHILLDTIQRNDQPTLHLGVGVVAGWQARDQLAVAKTLRKRWRRFKAAQPFWDD